MDLQRNSVFYNSVLSSKRQALYAAVKLANGLEIDIAGLRDKTNIECCEAALLKFKESIIDANRMKKSSQDLRSALTNLSKFNEIIPEAQSKARDHLEQCLDSLESSEYSRKRWDKGWEIGGQVLLVAGLAAAIVLIALFGPPGFFIVPLTPSFVLAMLTSFLSADNVSNIERRATRDVISDRIAIAKEELEDLLYPLIPTQQYQEAYAMPTPSAPVMTTGQYAFKL